MALSLNPRTDNDPHVVDGKISLYEQRINANALSIAAEENLDIRQALLPYPSPGNMEVLATTFGLKRKVIGHEATRLRNLRKRSTPSGAAANVVDDSGMPSSPPEFIYFMYHKPPGCMTERSDRGIVTIYDAIPTGFPHVPHVGRLDKETEGLMLFTDDGALAAGLSNPTYFGIPENWQPIHSVKPSIIMDDYASPSAIVDGDRTTAKDTSGAAKESATSSMATHAQKVYHVCVTGLAWTSADLEWFDSLPQCSQSEASSTTLAPEAAGEAEVAAGHVVPHRGATSSEGEDAKVEQENDRLNNDYTNESSSAARVIPLVPPLEFSTSAKRGIGGEKRSSFGSRDDVIATSSPSLSSSLVQPPTLHCRGGLSAKGWRWHIQFGTAKQQLEALRHPLEYFGSDQSGRDTETTMPATVRFLGHSSYTTGAATAVWLEFTLEEGRNRQIRRLCARSGLEVVVLRRMSFGALHLGSLFPGHARALTPAEVTASYHAAFGPRDSSFPDFSCSRDLTPQQYCPATVVPLPMTTAALDLDSTLCTTAATVAYSKAKAATEAQSSTGFKSAES